MPRSSGLVSTVQNWVKAIGCDPGFADSSVLPGGKVCDQLIGKPRSMPQRCGCLGRAVLEGNPPSIQAVRKVLFFYADLLRNNTIVRHGQRAQ